MTAEQIAKKIKRRRLGVFKSTLLIFLLVIIIAIILVELKLPQESYTFIFTFCVLLLMGSLFYLNLNSRKKLQDIVLVQGNPELFKEVYSLLNKKEKFAKRFDLMICDFYYSFFSGDYKTYISSYESSRSILNLTLYELISYYIQSLFFINDLNGLRTAYDEFAKKRNAKFFLKSAQKQFSNIFSIIDFAYYYLKGDYESAYQACISYTEPPKNAPIHKFYIMYYTALCERALGNEEAALEKFRYIANQDNTLDITRMAKENLKCQII